MLQNKKRVFWEALLLTLIIFSLGMLLGAAFERNKLDEVNKYYLGSEVLLMDVSLLESNVQPGENLDYRLNLQNLL